MAVIVDGRRVLHYARAFLANGRVYATTRLAGSLVDKMWFSGGLLTFERGGRTVSVRLPGGWPVNLDATYVALAPVLRRLGDAVQFRNGALEVRTPIATPVATPTPYVPPAVTPLPRAVFTPEPVPTARPVWTGSPLPRRTPLPLPPGGSSR